MKICFVCVANICRSFIAQELLKKLLNDKKITDIEVFSRGTFVFSHFEIPQKIKNFLKKNDIEYIKHIPKLISKQDLENADMIFVMTKEILDELNDKYSQFGDKIFLLYDYCYGTEKDIEDPINKEGLSFKKIAGILKQATEVLAQKITANR